MRFNGILFLTKEVGTAQAVLALFTAFRIEAPKLATIEKWFQRGSIPGGWLAMILAILELEKGSPVQMTKYIEKGRQE